MGKDETSVRVNGRALLTFGLRSFLAFVLLVAIAFGFARREARQQRDLVDELERIGCRVWFDHSTRSDTATERLRRLFAEEEPRNVQGILADNAPIQDSDLVCFQEFTHLRYLSLGGTTISDLGLIHLRQLTSLVRLELGGSRVSETGAAGIKAALPHCNVGYFAPASPVEPVEVDFWW